MATTILDCYVGAELNTDRIEIQQNGVAVGSSWMGLVTRVVLRFSTAVVDSNTAAAGTFDWTTESAGSILRITLGRDITTADGLTAGKYNARLDIYHGADNAVITHDLQKSLKVRVWPDVA